MIPAGKSAAFVLFAEWMAEALMLKCFGDLSFVVDFVTV